MELPRHAQVSVIVIGHDDATHVADAVRSALAQGPVVREVIAVDDGSTDGSREVLAALAAGEPRLRVLPRAGNSGGCGTPRNDGLAACTAPYVMFLDSDDLLPPRAAERLLTAAQEHRAQVAAGLCVRRELPHGPDTPWQPRLYTPRPTGPGDPALPPPPSAPTDAADPSDPVNPAEDPLDLVDLSDPWKPADPAEPFDPAEAAPRPPAVPEGDPAGPVGPPTGLPVVEHPADLPALARDTLCVNKLYRTDFLRDHGIRFPDGRFPYEDFVFTARVLAAGPRIARVPDPVYVWHVRRGASRLSISLDRAGVDNWRARTRAHGQAVDILRAAGAKSLARASRAAFLDLSLRMYAKELVRRSPEYRRLWWADARAHLAGFDSADLEPADSPGRLVARVLLVSPEPRDLVRLRELAARPARLLPPYARDPDGTPVWSAELPGATLEKLVVRPAAALPLAVEGRLRPRARGTLLRLRLHELYGRVAAAGPVTAVAEFAERRSGRVGWAHAVEFTAGRHDGTWTAEAAVPLRELGAGTWDLRVRLRFADGTGRRVTAHATEGPGDLRRHAVPDPRHGFLLAQPYATHSGALALRIALGPRGALGVARRRLVRLLRPGGRRPSP
ncbi:glycosyltransferase [Streptomyces uncialis]|uniref:glycosyltransferase n=1 Tax=Streptomyces uncialis TaxID=1048205 RepID=UPI003808493C